MLRTYLQNRTMSQLKEEFRFLGEEIETIQATTIAEMNKEKAEYLVSLDEQYEAIDKEIDRRILEEIEKDTPMPASIRRVS